MCDVRVRDGFACWRRSPEALSSLSSRLSVRLPPPGLNPTLKWLVKVQRDRRPTETLRRFANTRSTSTSACIDHVSICGIQINGPCPSNVMFLPSVIDQSCSVWSSSHRASKIGLREKTPRCLLKRDSWPMWTSTRSGHCSFSRIPCCVCGPILLL